MYLLLKLEVQIVGETTVYSHFISVNELGIAKFEAIENLWYDSKV